MKIATRNICIIVLGLGAVVALGVAAGHRGDSAALTVQTATLRRQTFVIKLPENGMVEAPQVATIPTLVSGNIGAVYVRAGDQVVEGQVLATIDNPSLAYTAAASRADVIAAEANVNAARVQEQNAKVSYVASVATDKEAFDEAKRVYNQDVELYANKAIPRDQLDSDKTKLEQAHIAYDQAVDQERLGAVSGYNGSNVQTAIAASQKSLVLAQQSEKQLDSTIIRAPFSGVIQSVTSEPGDALRSLHAGDAVTEGGTLFTIAAASQYVVKAEVDEQDIINVRPAQRAWITGQDFPGRRLTGRVAEISPMATKSSDPSSTARQVLTTIRLDRAAPYLRDGMSADVDILTTLVRSAIVIPNAAIAHARNIPFVYVVRGRVAQRRDIRVGAASDTVTYVVSGLSPGETIVVKNVPGLSDGRQVLPALPEANVNDRH